MPNEPARIPTTLSCYQWERIVETWQRYKFEPGFDRFGPTLDRLSEAVPRFTRGLLADERVTIPGLPESVSAVIEFGKSLPSLHWLEPALSPQLKPK